MIREPGGLQTRDVCGVAVSGGRMQATLPCGEDELPIPGRPGAKLILYSGFDSLGKSEGWHSYDYDGGIESGSDVFYPVNWEPKGGAFGSGFIWTDDSRWRIDTPEQPNSILALIFYRRWVGGPKLDLRGARISVNLRGDGLDLKGAQCYFWAHIGNNRWHFTDHPLPISQGTWGKRHYLRPGERRVQMDPNLGLDGPGQPGPGAAGVCELRLLLHRISRRRRGDGTALHGRSPDRGPGRRHAVTGLGRRRARRKDSATVLP